ncbi:MAG: MarR family transcriptional regulator [Anaerolineaceae bacterium]|nr:MarR family transcriptional regulator [Anaerolineaceae bacterium]
MAEEKNQVLINAAITRFWETIPPVWHSVRDNVRGYAAADFGLTVEQFYVLRHIRRGARTVSDLAAARKISNSAISQSVEVLVEKGLLSRSSQKEDRRFVYLALTDEGNAVLTAIFEKNHAWMEQKLASLSQSDLQVVIHAMNLLDEKLNNEKND